MVSVSASRLTISPPLLLVSVPLRASVAPLSPCRRPLLVSAPVVMPSVPPCILPSLVTEAAVTFSAPPDSRVPPDCWLTAPVWLRVRPFTPLMAPLLLSVPPVSVRFFAAHCPWFASVAACSVAAPSAVILLPAVPLSVSASVICSASALCTAPLLVSDRALSRIFCACQLPALVTAPDAIVSAPWVRSLPPAPLISSCCGAAIAMRAISRCCP